MTANDPDLETVKDQASIEISQLWSQSVQSWECDVTYWADWSLVCHFMEILCRSDQITAANAQILQFTLSNQL